ncbi:MAG: hypothetical protein DRQ47_07500 [Gammaproteobacteria bacterium]|nr:MAG: hypothetical protein DRQ47_07500 [Gammaproteobacteria bacterium]
MVNDEVKMGKRNECYSCEHRRNISGDTHISCMNPDRNMEGNIHGMKNGWFQYPYNFDPCWKLVPCANFKEKVVKHYGK